ncbi:MAG: VCBS repeat-containing protein [Thermoguttaceae bacterium]|nr:VCBS repeat-containing protein [Thermoguttaceae bacterium]MDW8079428.1 VCBS repeat-containing protein [Thermoguttaceae bacterium]
MAREARRSTVAVSLLCWGLLVGASFVGLYAQETKQADLRFRHFVVDVGLEGRGFGQTALVDLTGDGRPEFVVGVAFGPIFVYEYKQADRWVRYRVAEESASEVGLAVVDVNRDGRKDLVTGGAWYPHSGDLHKPFQRIVFDPNLRNVHDMAVADIDGDGRQDIVCLSDRADLRWYRIPDDSQRQWPFVRIGPPVHAGLAVGDLNGDGRTDVVRSTVWYENVDGGKTWREHEIGPTSPLPPDFQRSFALYATKACVIDLNRDGKQDIVFTDAEMPGGKVWWMENVDGQGTRWQRHDIFTPQPGQPRRGAFHSLVVADFTGDGAEDVFSAEMEWIRGEEAPCWYIWENVDKQGQTWREHVILNINLGGHECVAGDVNGDGKLDILGKPWIPHPKNALGGKSFVLYLENASR